MQRVFNALGAALLLGAITVAAAPGLAGAQTSSASAANTAASDAVQIAQLNQEIANYQAQLQQVGANKKTLQNAINTLNLQKETLQTQVQLTQTKINAAQTQIAQLGQHISVIEKNIQVSQLAIGDDIREEEESGSEPLLEQVLSSQGLSGLWNETADLSQVDAAVQSKVQLLEAQQNDLASSQTATQQTQATLVAQKGTLTTQQKQVVATANQQKQLLTETDAQETQYEKLLAQAEAQLNSFSTFSENAPSGSGLLTNQTTCDSWGCYYNQRDAQWGDDALDGTSYTMKSDGCLVTAMAMIMTHYGATGVTPEIINDDPSDFAAYEPAYLLATIQAGGMTATRKASTIDATLATGNPVVVGLNAYGGTHFVVLVSGKKGNYVMKDPYIPDGNDVSFSAHYSLGQIYAIDKVVTS